MTRSLIGPVADAPPLHPSARPVAGVATRALGALLVALFAAAPAGAQEPGAGEAGEPPGEQAWIRVTPVKATGTLRDGDQPAVPPALQPFAPLLAPLAYDRYTPVAPAPAPISGPAGAALEVELPLRYRATVRWEQGEAGRLTLDVTVTRARPVGVSSGAAGTDSAPSTPDETPADGAKPGAPASDPPGDGRLKVVDVSVRTLPGGHVLINCKGAYPDGDLLLLVTARLEPFTEPRQGS